MAWGKDTPKAVWGGEKPPWQRPRAAPPAGREANLTRLRCPLRAACGKEDETFDEQALFEHMQLFHLSQVRPLDKPKTNGTCLSTDPTPEELDDIQLACAKLWQLDHNRLQAGKDYTLNLQGGKSIWQKGDMAKERLFESVNEEVFNRDTYRAFMQLLDNYDRSTSHEDRLSAHEVTESYAFLNECMEEPCGIYLHKYLQAKKLAPQSMRSFCQQLFKVWFKTFGRGEAKGASSGFEHVFLGEEDTTKEGKLTIAGFHNWIQFYFEERCGHLDYQGYILPKRRGRKSGDPPDGSESFLSVQFEWEGEMKPVSGMFVGVSPEFELALYSLLYYCGQDDNKMHLGDVDLNIRVYRLDRIGCLSSAFPEAVASLDA